MTLGEERIIVEGLAALAGSGFEMGDSHEQVRERLIQLWNDTGCLPGAFSAAAVALQTFPQPLIESAEQTERMRPIREKLGVQSADEQLLATMAGKELLQQLALELDS